MGSAFADLLPGTTQQVVGGATQTVQQGTSTVKSVVPAPAPTASKPAPAPSAPAPVKKVTKTVGSVGSNAGGSTGQLTNQTLSNTGSTAGGTVNQVTQRATSTTGSPSGGGGGSLLGSTAGGGTNGGHTSGTSSILGSGGGGGPSAGSMADAMFGVDLRSGNPSSGGGGPIYSAAGSLVAPGTSLFGGRGLATASTAPLSGAAAANAIGAFFAFTLGGGPWSTTQIITLPFVEGSGFSSPVFLAIAASGLIDFVQAELRAAARIAGPPKPAAVHKPAAGNPPLPFVRPFADVGFTTFLILMSLLALLGICILTLPAFRRLRMSVW